MGRVLCGWVRGCLHAWEEGWMGVWMRVWVGACWRWVGGSGRWVGGGCGCAHICKRWGQYKLTGCGAEDVREHHVRRQLLCPHVTRLLILGESSVKPVAEWAL